MNPELVENTVLPRYRYQPLEGPKWIRVVQLQPSTSPEAPLLCKIVHMNRERLTLSTDRYMNHYLGVSYVWGDNPIFSQNLICCQSEGNLSIKITPNVETMLRRLRKPTKPINLWIDAACLDQLGNSLEIQEQVQMMGEIYNEARQVLVWMGDEEGEIAKVFSFFRTLQWLERQISNGSLTDDTARETLFKKILEAFGSDLSTAIKQFLDNRWFRRRWVLQELALSEEATFCCHEERIPSKILSASFRMIQKFGLEAYCGLDSEAQTTLQMVTSLNGGRRFVLDNLWHFHACECFDPRDRLFSLVGFSQSEKGQIDHGATVNYSISTERTFLNFAAQNIHRGRLWNVCQHAVAFGPLRFKCNTLPSWCPDWSQARDNEKSQIGMNIDMGSPPADTIDNPVISGWNKDSRSILIRQPFAAVYRSTGNWPEDVIWADVMRLLVPLLPSACLGPEKLLASILCQMVKAHIDTGVLGAIPFTCSQKTTSIDGDVMASECRERAEKCMEHYLQQLFLYLIFPCGTSPLSEMPVIVQNFLDDNLLPAIVCVLKEHKLFSATATLQDYTHFDSLGEALTRDLNYYEKGTEIAHHSGMSYDPHHVLYFGLGPANFSAGDKILLPWSSVMNRPVWPLVQIGTGPTFALKQQSRLPVEETSSPGSTADQQDITFNLSSDETKTTPAHPLEKAADIEKLHRHEKIQTATLHDVAIIYWQSHIVSTALQKNHPLLRNYRDMKWHPVNRLARMESLGAFDMEEVSKRQEYFVKLI